MNRIDIFVFGDDPGIELSGMTHALNKARATFGRFKSHDYRVVKVNALPGREAQSLIDESQAETLVLLADDTANPDPAMRLKLQFAASRAKRVVTTGTMTRWLAQAGTLDGHAVCCLKQEAEELTKAFPNVQWDADSLYRQSGKLWSCAGQSAILDLTLALVQQDFDRKTALKLAERLIVFMFRAGSHQQISPVLNAQITSETTSFDDLALMILADPGKDWSVTALAQSVGMSNRSFARRFTGETGCSPAKYVELLRLEHARDLLEESELSIKEIAVKSGFLDVERLRRSFHRNLGSSPAEYREQIAGIL